MASFGFLSKSFENSSSLNSSSLKTLRIKETNFEAFDRLSEFSHLSKYMYLNFKVANHFITSLTLYTFSARIAQVTVRFEGVYAKPVPVSFGYDHLANKRWMNAVSSNRNIKTECLGIQTAEPADWDFATRVTWLQSHLKFTFEDQLFIREIITSINYFET